MKIWVPALPNRIVGRKVTVNFPKPTYGDQSDIDDAISGEFEIVKLREKIIKEYAVQELHLARPGKDE